MSQKASSMVYRNLVLPYGLILYAFYLQEEYNSESGMEYCLKPPLAALMPVVPDLTDVE